MNTKETLKYIMKAMGYTQSDIGKLTNRSQQQISNYKKEGFKIPKDGMEVIIRKYNELNNYGEMLIMDYEKNFVKKEKKEENKIEAFPGRVCSDPVINYIFEEMNRIKTAEDKRDKIINNLSERCRLLEAEIQSIKKKHYTYKGISEDLKNASVHEEVPEP